MYVVMNRLYLSQEKIEESYALFSTEWMSKVDFKA